MNLYKTCTEGSLHCTIKQATGTLLRFALKSHSLDFTYVLGFFREQLPYQVDTENADTEKRRLRAWEAQRWILY